MHRDREVVSALKSLARGPTTVVLGDELCPSTFAAWVEGLASDPCTELSDEGLLKVIKRSVLSSLDAICVATVCVDDAFRKVFGKSLVYVYGSCRSGLDRVAPKHSVDEFLKCVAASETMLVLGLSKPLSIVSEAIVVASSMGKSVVVASSSPPSFLSELRNVTVVKLDLRSLANLE